jgi:predicted house-cleaning noncanonical NTP pyrophosphatase (MazG superfamily)
MARSNLVRDRIPEFIRADGLEPVIHVATSAEYAAVLRDKLQEEGAEFLGAQAAEDPETSLKELADIPGGTPVTRDWPEQQLELRSRKYVPALAVARSGASRSSREKCESATRQRVVDLPSMFRK